MFILKVDFLNNIRGKLKNIFMYVCILKCCVGEGYFLF